LNKHTLLIQLIDQLQQEINATKSAVDEAHALASHEQSKPENQYDTLALEAAYLAHGQSERIAELQRQIILLNHFEFSEFDEDSQIALGAVVEVSTLDSEGLINETQWLWLLPVAGGCCLSYEDKEVRTITPEAPLAQKIVGSLLGEEFELQIGHTKKQFEISELL
jgi:transcription elongation GreA/GreB family factor